MEIDSTDMSVRFYGRIYLNSALKKQINIIKDLKNKWE